VEGKKFLFRRDCWKDNCAAARSETTLNINRYYRLDGFNHPATCLIVCLIGFRILKANVSDWKLSKPAVRPQWDGGIGLHTRVCIGGVADDRK
jgi:hypothetical protein